MAKLQFIKPQWNAPDNVYAVQTTREGGNSAQPYDGFNLALHVDDDEEIVNKNRDLLNKSLALPNPPIWLQQVHETAVLNLSEPTLFPELAPADAAITSKSGVVCCVMTADCLPLLLCDQQGTQVAAVHAGWRGMAQGIIEKAVASFDAPAADLIAWAGPCISAKHFEVGEEVREQLAGPDHAWRKGLQGKWFADLYALAGHRLADLGVTQYTHSSECTFANQESFFSHRRDGVTGRQASLIWMK